jgi:hypothetical protein
MEFLARRGVSNRESKGRRTHHRGARRGTEDFLGFALGRRAWQWKTLAGTVVVHSPRIAQVDFSVKVRCHKKKVNIGADKGPDGSLAARLKSARFPVENKKTWRLQVSAWDLA